MSSSKKAVEKKTTKPEEPVEEVTSEQQVFKLKIKAIGVKENDKNWTMKAQNIFAFVTTQMNYIASIVVDQEYFENKIRHVKNEIERTIANPDLFMDWKERKGDLEQDIETINKQRAEYAKKEVENFDVTVQQVDYTTKNIVFVIGEKAIMDILKIRENFEGYVMNLH